jgi:hypothetical protein
MAGHDSYHQKNPHLPGCSSYEYERSKDARRMGGMAVGKNASEMPWPCPGPYASSQGEHSAGNMETSDHEVAPRVPCHKQDPEDHPCQSLAHLALCVCPG